MSGLRNDLYDVGLALAGEVDSGVVATPVWRRPADGGAAGATSAAGFQGSAPGGSGELSTGHVQTPLCEWYNRQRERLFRTADVRPTVAEYVSTHSLMMTLVAAGYGVGLARRIWPVAIRPCRGSSAGRSDRLVDDLLLRLEGEITEPLQQFIDRVERVGRVRNDD